MLFAITVAKFVQLFIYENMFAVGNVNYIQVNYSYFCIIYNEYS